MQVWVIPINQKLMMTGHVQALFLAGSGEIVIEVLVQFNVRRTASRFSPGTWPSGHIR